MSLGIFLRQCLLVKMRHAILLCSIYNHYKMFWLLLFAQYIFAVGHSQRWKWTMFAEHTKLWEIPKYSPLTGESVCACVRACAIESTNRWKKVPQSIYSFTYLFYAMFYWIFCDNSHFLPKKNKRKTNQSSLSKLNLVQ